VRWAIYVDPKVLGNVGEVVDNISTRRWLIGKFVDNVFG